MTVVVMLSGLMFQSCFTGIEHTGHISLSKKDREITHRISKEEAFMADIHGAPLSRWARGREFNVDATKVAMVFDQVPDTLQGNTLKYEAFELIPTPGGTQRVNLLFRDPAGNICRYNSTKSDTAKIISTELPFLIDETLIQELASKLRGRTLWTRTPEWKTSDGKQVAGRKFEAVKVLDVLSGTENLPFLIKFVDEKGDTAYISMTQNQGTLASRPFHSLFAIDNPRKNFANISDENWENIRNGRVSLGMTKTECRLALGSPDDTDTGRDYSKTIDIWTYANGIFLRFEDGLLVTFRK